VPTGYEDFDAGVRELTTARVWRRSSTESGRTHQGSAASLRPRATLALFGAANSRVRGFDPADFGAAPPC
jgi:NADPH:quinone reductase